MYAQTHTSCPSHTTHPTQTHRHTLTHTYIHTHNNTHTCTQTHTHANTQTHTHTHTHPALWPSRSVPSPWCLDSGSLITRAILSDATVSSREASPAVCNAHLASSLLVLWHLMFSINPHAVWKMGQQSAAVKRRLQFAMHILPHRFWSYDTGCLK